jgi:hypothetical protein
MMTWVRMTRGRRVLGRLAAVALLAAALGGCAGLPTGPTYTDQELRAICERQGGWWRGALIPGYCEYQTASMSQSP